MNIIILEDNVNDLNNTLSILREWESKTYTKLSIRTYSSIKTFFHHANLLWADVLLLNIHFINTCASNAVTPPPEKNGIDVAKKLRILGYDTPIVFLSSHQDYVFEGYKVHAIDYLLKPLTLEAIAPSLLEIQNKIRNHFYLFQTNTGIYRIPYDNILFLNAHFTQFIS